MGRKQSTMWKYFYICFTLIVVFTFGSGCAVLREMGPGGVAQRHLDEAERRLAKKDYEGSLSESQTAFSQTSDPNLKQKALFQMAIVYSHQGSHHKDYKKAVSTFRTLSESKPQSPFALYAQMWLSLREANTTLTDQNRKLKQILEKIKQVDIEIEQKRRQ